MSIKSRRFPRTVVAGLSFTLAAGCSDGTSVDVSVLVTPAAAELRVGDTQELTATVSGTTDTRVRWVADCGTFGRPGNTVAYENTVTYAAPWGPGKCTVTATSWADAGESASTEIAVTLVPEAQNLLANPDFESNLAPWTTYLDDGQPRAVWNADDAGGNPSSGSAHLNHPNPGGDTIRLALDYCIPSAPGVEYRFGGTVKHLQDIQVDEVGVWVLFGPAEDGCGDFDLDPTTWLGFNFGAGNANVWRPNGTTFTTPAGTTTVRLSVGIFKYSDFSAPITARVDDLFLLEVD